ncbi:MAG: PLP-dependent aminotransferase family protein [Acutalibacteraceae bacterium]|jgi:2-aminoadipate transaminase
MDFTFANRVQALKPSAIREIFKYAADPEVVSLSAGNPAPQAFPVDAVRAISERLLREDPVGALQYSVTEGYPPLREHLSAYLRQKHGLGGEGDELLITSGAQQAMEMVAKVLCNEGDEVICESPSFVGSLNSFRSIGAGLVGVPMQPDGMDVDALEEVLKTHPRAKFLYTIPNFQNPTGACMSAEKRRRVYELCRSNGVLIVEDNPYGDLRFAGEDLPAIKSMDEDGGVLYVGSFSKVLAPGLRVGYAVGPKPLIQKMVVVKQGEDVHTGIWAQRICHAFMTRYDFEAHLQTLRTIYRRKARYTMDLMDRYLIPAGITYRPIEGGLFLWCDLPKDADPADFCARAVKEYKVAAVPGTAFLTDERQPCHSLRINYSTPTDEALAKGIERLGAFAKEYLTQT